MMAKRKPLLVHDLGVRLYAPSDAVASHRVVWRDPFTQKRVARRYPDRTAAEMAFTQAVDYLRGVTSYVHATTDAEQAKPSATPTVDSLFRATVERWGDLDREPRYIEKRAGLFRRWVQPVCGNMTVFDWASTDEHCLRVLRNARQAGLKDSTVQNIGALMRVLVTTAHARRLLPVSMNPMSGVRYAAGKQADDEGAEYVAPSARPTTEMVNALAEAFERREDAPWMGLMVKVAAFTGVRLGKLTALRVNSFDPSRRSLLVAQAWSHSQRSGTRRKKPKNTRRRTVLLPKSVADLLETHVEKVRAEHGDEGLLFPNPTDPAAPLTEGLLRRRFEACAREAGWECHPDRRSSTGRNVKGRPVVPWKNLRHHAAVWLHDVAGFDWADVSRVLGHHSVAFTLATYVRPSADAEQRNADKLAGL